MAARYKHCAVGRDSCAYAGRGMSQSCKDEWLSTGLGRFRGRGQILQSLAGAHSAGQRLLGVVRRRRHAAAAPVPAGAHGHQTQLIAFCVTR